MQSKTSSALKVALLVLSVAIFAWGLQYKLSLYQAPSQSSPVTVAKLIQGEQTNKKAVGLQSQSRYRCPPFLLQSTFQAFQPPMVVRRERPANPPVVASVRLLTSLFFRPPPQKA
jgi:hypothetical protein